jgi:hypothetical protein
MVCLVVTDASHAGETEVVDTPKGKSTESYRSQSGRMTMVGSSSFAGEDKGHFHIIGHASTILRRVCRATLQAEAYSMQLGVEAGDVLRATIAELHGRLDMHNWEASAAAFMRQIWFTDCRSLQEALVRPTMAKIADKRLAIEVASMRQSLWRTPGEKESDSLFVDSIPADATDKVRWIDTEVMIADPLTKKMQPDKLQEALDTCVWDLAQPISSVVKKRAKQLHRRRQDLTHDDGG